MLVFFAGSKDYAVKMPNQVLHHLFCFYITFLMDRKCYGKKTISGVEIDGLCDESSLEKQKLLGFIT